MSGPLSGAQFHRVQFNDGTIYAAQHEGWDPHSGMKPTAEVKVDRPTDRYTYNQDLFHSPYDSSYREHPETRGTQNHDAAFHANDKGMGAVGWTGVGADGQTALFENRHYKPSLAWMAAHEDLKEHIPTLLGVAANDTKRKYGVYPEASNDLSQHSARFVDRLAAKGVIEPRDTSRPLNSIHADDPEYRYFQTLSYGQRGNLAEADLAAGRRTIREALRGKGQPSRAAEFVKGQVDKGKQGVLFGEAR